ncbi:MAG: Glu/Leu/Phe/Val dehydrogenase [Chloroflexi bacterium]|nr:Glu/Leu/Phe/Val dehydrogenase [Chloroflexota bacterium]
MDILDYMVRYGHEQVVYCSDPSCGLRAVIAVHDTTLGPSLGGTRMWPFPSEEAATIDVLRLSRAMTYKAAAAGLHLGGGKAVIMADPAKDKTEALFRSFGRFVDSLDGRYITTEDVGTTVRDMEWISTETEHVVGVPVSQGGSGDPSPATGFGVYQAMRACAQEVFGADSLQGKTVALQGFGKVASYLAGHLREAGASLVACDVSPRAAERAKKEFGARIVSPDEICDVECDIFAPCALGGVLNDSTIPRIKAPITCGGANNQLLEDRHAEALKERGILWAPDYVANAGGLINLSFEPTGYDEDAAHEKVSEIRQTMERIIAIAKAEGITTARAADRLVEQRLAAVRGIRRLAVE